LLNNINKDFAKKKKILKNIYLYRLIQRLIQRLIININFQKLSKIIAIIIYYICKNLILRKN